MQSIDSIVMQKPLRFLGAFFVAFFLTAVVLFAIDFVPEKPTENDSAVAKEEANHVSQQNVVTVPDRVEDPTRIVIRDIGVDTKIQNPSSISIEALDEALLAGAVRYPGTARLGDNATMFLFGHQSYLPVVKNKAFKAFNDLQKLEAGDTIQVYSDTLMYEYEVESVSLVEASEALIPLSPNERILMLSTCNSFGDPGERYVVKARYSSHTELN